MRPRKPRADRRALRIARCLVASSPALGAAERFLREGRLAAPARPAPASFRRLIRCCSSCLAARKLISSSRGRGRPTPLARWARRLSARAALPSENHSPSAGSGRMILLRSFLRPGLRRLAWFRSALRAPVICSPSSCVGQESRLLKPACRSAQTPSGVFLFSGRFAPASQRVAAFRPPLPSFKR